MATSPDVTSMALFCDFENVALGVRDTQHDKFDIKLVLERLLLKGSIVVKKAYCDWDRYKSFKSTMHEANFELIEIPHVRQSGKNSADIRLVVDALDLCYTKAHVNTFVIISGDSDFSPLVSKLRENNKQVIGVGVKQSTSDLLVTNCDEFIFYDDLYRESGRQAVRREQRPPQEKARRAAPSTGNAEESRRREEADARRTKGVEMALQTFEALYSERGDGGKIWASVLKEAIKRRKPDFSESYYGFRSFGGLLEEMQARGFLKMGRDEKSNSFVFRSSGAEAGSGSVTEPAPTAPDVLPVTHRSGETEAREPRGRGTRARGGRRGAPERHDFEATVAVEPPQAPLFDHAEEDDDAAERFADAARETQASRSTPPAEPAPDVDVDATDDSAEAPAAREGNPRRGNRGGRGGRGNAARTNAEPRARAERAERAVDAPAPVPAPMPAPAPTPVPVAAEAPAPAAKAARARKTAAAKPATTAAAKKPAAKKAAAPRAARKTKAADPDLSAHVRASFPPILSKESSVRLRHTALFAATLLAAAASAQAAPKPKPPTVAEAQAFMDKAEAELTALDLEGVHAGWVSQTDINDDTDYAASKAQERESLKYNDFVVGARRFDKLVLPPALARKYKLLKLNGSPTDPKLVAELAQTSVALGGMYGKGKYCVKGDAANCLGIEDIGVRMAKSRDPAELLDLWTGWHAIAPPMRDKFTRLVQLSNQGAHEFGFKDTGDLWRAGYDMTPDQFSEELETTWRQLQPLYAELHAYVRFKLIQKYGAAAQRPDGMIPAHLLGNPWAQEWGNVYDLVQPTDPALANVKLIDLEGALKKQIAAQHPDAAPAFSAAVDPSSDAGHAAAVVAAKAMAAYGERFYTSIGFDPLPPTFWERSLFVRPRDRDAVCHPSAWFGFDAPTDIRIKMCTKVDADDFTTVHHEEGHLMYGRAYVKQPYLFRAGADDGFHEAIGDSVALAVTPAYLKQIGLIDTLPPVEADIPLQLRTALDKVAFLPFGLLIDKWRWQVFSGQIKPADYNKAWWSLREQYQGVAPPVARSEADFDPGAKYHIASNVPYARYYLATLYQFQFYKAMCGASGYTGPLNRCTFYGSKAAGAKLQAMLEVGASQPAQVTLKAMTGSDHLDAAPMLEYFRPLYDWLKKQNEMNKATPGWKAQ